MTTITNSASATATEKPEHLGNIILRTACWNVRRGLIKREKEIEVMLKEQDLDMTQNVQQLKRVSSGTQQSYGTMPPCW